MKGKLRADAGEIEAGTAIDIGSKVGTNASRCAEDAGGESTTKAPVYAITDPQATTKRSIPETSSFPDKRATTSSSRSWCICIVSGSVHENEKPPSAPAA